MCISDGIIPNPEDFLKGFAVIEQHMLSNLK